MNWETFLSAFQGIEAALHSTPQMVFARLGLILLGFLLIYLGKKGVLEAMLMIPMGLGMSVINASVMLFDPLGLHGGLGTLFLEAQAGAGPDNVKNAADLMYIMGIDWLQPVYSFTFSNGLIACLVFMGIGTLLDVGFVMARPFLSITLALFAELGTIFTLPLAQMFGYTAQQAAAISVVGGADGPMVLFTSLRLAPELFVPIAVVAYLYLGLAYGGYPYLIKFMVPNKKLRGLQMPADPNAKQFTSGQKMVFAVVACVILCFLLPVAAPLLFSLFFGIVIRESGIKQFQQLLDGPILYGSTMFLGMTLGILCEANTILDPKVLPLLLLGITSLLFSGIGGLIGGYVCYLFTKGKVNPVVGIAGVSCVPTTAKVAQKVVTKANPSAIIMQYALGANVMGVITTAIIAGVFCSILK
ncbi:MAG: sodium ion-translocating decarboxylase subunit beta [Fibrobacterota bacterium]|nr:sodium ion-translocating decarboxylase subunit beta [Chitinispirillaceae bacterium]